MEVGQRLKEVKLCPRCNDSLCDTDSLDASGGWLAVPYPSDWSRERRAALSYLQESHELRYEDGWWRVRPDDADHDTTSTQSLDAIVELAKALRLSRQ